jgi:Fe-S cluster assembly iron-binding protein IscA
MKPSEKAIEKLKEDLFNRFSNTGIGFRVLMDTKSTGVARLALKLDQKKPGDETMEYQGICLYLDPASSSHLKDLELDYIDGPTGGFVLKKCEG